LSTAKALHEKVVGHGFWTATRAGHVKDFGGEVRHGYWKSWGWCGAWLSGLQSIDMVNKLSAPGLRLGAGTHNRWNYDR